MEEVRQLKELCDAMGPTNDGKTSLIAGRAEMPKIFGLLGIVIEKLEQRILSLEQPSTTNNPLIDLLNQVKKDMDDGTYNVAITPEKYGFKTEEEYWKRIRELAGFPRN